MAVSGQFDICPKCGFVCRDGVCQSCGYKLAGVKVERPDYTGPENFDTTGKYTGPVSENGYTGYENKNENQEASIAWPDSGNTYNNAAYENQSGQGSFRAVDGFTNDNGGVTPPGSFTNEASGKSHRIPGALIAVFAILSLLFFVFVLMVGVVGIYSGAFDDNDIVFDTPDYNEETVDGNTVVLRTPDYEGVISDYILAYQDYLGYDYPSEAEESRYEGSTTDYYEFADDIRTDLSYSLLIGAWGFDNSDAYYDTSYAVLPHNLFVYAEYPGLENTGLSENEEDEINQLLFEYSVCGTDLYDYVADKLDSLYEGLYITVEPYITYMDEDIISVVYYTVGYYITDLNTDDEAYIRITAYLKSVNIDLHTGLVIDASDVFDIDDNFVKVFVETCDSQNGAAIEENYTDDELLEIMKSDDFVWFYTPCGVEYGVNYKNFGGFCTYTCFDRDRFLKIY